MTPTHRLPLVLALSVAACFTVGPLAAPTAEARDRHGGYYEAHPRHYTGGPGYARHHDRDDGFAWAEVIRVDPMIVSDYRPVRREECWEEPVHYTDYAHYQRVGSRGGSEAGVVLGAIAGGVLGNQVGGGRGRIATTAAGAALGGALVRDAQRAPVRGVERVPLGERVTYEQRCRMTTDHVGGNRVEGYLVTYRYGERSYQTRTAHHPGDYIRVRVDVTPAF